MTDPAPSRHGLEPLLAAAPAGGTGIGLCVHASRGYLNLRGPADAAGFGEAVEAVVGTGLPGTPNTVSRGQQRIFWLGPDEWLIESPAAQSRLLRAQLGPALSAWHHGLVDVSGGLTVLSLAGVAVRELLARGCTLDLHSDRFRAGDCAQTGLGRAAVLMTRDEDPARFELIVRRSFADYVVRWLMHSGEAFGLHVSCE